MTEKEFMKLSLPERVEWVISHTPSKRPNRIAKGKSVAYDEFAEMVGVATNTVHGWRRDVEPRESAQTLADYASRAGLKVRAEAFLRQPGEVVSLESIDRRLHKLEGAIAKLTRLVDEAVALLEAAAEPQSVPDDQAQGQDRVASG